MKKNILIGVCGGIAAYKTCELVRLFIKSGHQVKVVMTDGAKQFIQPQTFSALTSEPTYHGLFSEPNDPMQHIKLAKWADTIVIAPATASTIAQLAGGFCNDLLTTVCLASEANCYLAPAMNKIMWGKSVTQENLEKLMARGYQVIMPGEGEQACGDIGFGRMVEPEEIHQIIHPQSALFLGKKILITAGPTQEKIDPIRYISNFSSGKMGYAIATAAQQLGADVHLISGPVSLQPPSNCSFTSIITADDMLHAVHQSISNIDIFISTAAVSDYKPTSISTSKLKKNNQGAILELTQTHDILREVSESYPNVFYVGFCAETDNLIDHAQQKLMNKNLDAIVANQVTSDGYPFGHDTNELTYINHDSTISLKKETKNHLAKTLLHLIYDDYSAMLEKQLMTEG